MDVDSEMRRAVIGLTLIIAAGSLCAQSVRVFDVQINIQESCEINVRRKDQSELVKKLPFKTIGTCDFLAHSETNIPRIEFIHGEYVLLVESRSGFEGHCRAELAGIIVNRGGNIRVSKKTQDTTVCGSGERKSFEILRNFS